MIAVDWGTTSFRARRVDADGVVSGAVDAPRGILSVTDFPGTLRALVEPWLADGERRILMCGMVGSRQGWVEAPYLPCPAGPGEIARTLVRVPFSGAEVWLAPGLTDRDAAGVPEVMRGEETQLLSVLGADGPVCLPGTHTKWARVENGRVAGFATHMTGEVFAALRGHTILGRLMDGSPDEPGDDEAFARGVRRASDGGGLLHHLFGVRGLGLMGELAPAAAASYLSGLLLGHELAAALPPGGAAVRLIGSPALCARYARAVALCGGRTTTVPGEPAVDGLILLGKHVQWT